MKRMPPVCRAAGIAALLALAATGARAENHALIMWIGEYTDATANLPGLDNDARNARRIAAAMGVADANITELKNQQLTLAGMAGAVRALTTRIRQDDRVFIYYSGHGAQVNNTPGGAKPCSEGIVAQDIKLYDDKTLVDDLGRLAAKASQVVMLNDSCFSGGQATKQVDLTRGLERRVPKFLPLKLGAAAAAASAPRQCGDAINKSITITRNLEVVPARGAQLLYIAAAGENEVSYATDAGSPATQAWADCVASPEADKDHSGSVSGEELRACAQARMSRQPQRQTITVVGNAALPVTLAPPATAQATAVPVSAPRALADLRAASDAAYKVVLKAAKSTLRIGQDELDFSVDSNRAGYLYVLQVGSDGKTFNLLFPNKVDSDNHIAAGSTRLPRPSWRLRAAGPAGTGHLLALVSSVPKEFADLMDTSGTFAQAPATGVVTRNLAVEAAGARAGGGGRFGASDVVQIKEAP
jgi:hypothetical protein